MYGSWKVGSVKVTLDEKTTLTLEVTRGQDSVTAETTVDVVEGVAEGWALLDNFETYDGEPHDTCYGPSDFIKEISIEWEIFNMFDHKDKSEKLSSTGLTLLRRVNET